MSEEYLNLIAAIIKSGLQIEGPRYLRTAGGRYWCWLGGLDPQTVWEHAVRFRWQQEPLDESVKPTTPVRRRVRGLVAVEKGTVPH